MDNNQVISFENSYYANINTIHRIKDGSLIQIVDYKTNKEVYYKFLMEYNQKYFDKYIFCTTMQNILKGQIKNPFAKNQYGGWLGTNNLYRSKEYKWLYNIWILLLRRIYEDPSTIIDVVWLNYSNFAEWYMGEYNSRNHVIIDDYMISDTILYDFYKEKTSGKRVYSSHTCELIPRYFDVKLIDWYYKNNCISERLWNILNNKGSLI